MIGPFQTKSTKTNGLSFPPKYRGIESPGMGVVTVTLFYISWAHVEGLDLMMLLDFRGHHDIT